MKMSDLITEQILQMLDASGQDSAEIRRNEMAENMGCVPSQINYVLTSRFTPEQGYIVGDISGLPGCGSTALRRSCTLSIPSATGSTIPAPGPCWITVYTAI